MKSNRMLARFAAVTVAAMPFVGRTQIAVWPVTGYAYQRVDADSA